MTHSTTNAAAREPEKVVWAVIAENSGKLLNVYHGTQAKMDVDSEAWKLQGFYVRKMVLAATLTPQQGGEQEAGVEQQARELLAAEYERIGMDGAAAALRRGDNGMDYTIGAAFDAVCAALRSKQAAPSEGDGRDAARLDWLAREWEKNGTVSFTDERPRQPAICNLFTCTTQHIKARGFRAAIDAALAGSP